MFPILRDVPEWVGQVIAGLKIKKMKILLRIIVVVGVAGYCLSMFVIVINFVERKTNAKTITNCERTLADDATKWKTTRERKDKYFHTHFFVPFSFSVLRCALYYLFQKWAYSFLSIVWRMSSKYIYNVLPMLRVQSTNERDRVVQTKEPTQSEEKETRLWRTKYNRFIGTNGNNYVV